MTATPDAALLQPMSQWEEQLFAHFTAHTEQEVTLLGAYEDLARNGDTQFIRYLASLLLEDEQRHHRMFTQLANTLVSQANLTTGADDIPPLETSDDVARIAPLTGRLIALEEDDRVQLARLRKELRPVRDTTLWDLLVQLAERDTEKHLLILRFIDAASRQATRSQAR
ncbi:MAG TPA: hypothetical protein VFC09_01670 [Candidatus Dormibacteraeota bacterium]|nr:hypothetical protein [Candidatus Dormibacteraeota bacterium]